MKYLAVFKDIIRNRFFKDKIEKPWSSFEYFNPKWKKRIYVMAQYINKSEKSVLDLGCGEMWLKSFLEANVEYFGCDYIQRDSTTIVCDFNKHEFPSLRVDICFISGLLEYLVDLEWFFEKVSQTSKSIIISYCTIEYYSNIKLREKRGWKNHLSSFELILLITNKGYILTETNNKIKRNKIFKFEKRHN